MAKDTVLILDSTLSAHVRMSVIDALDAVKRERSWLQAALARARTAAGCVFGYRFRRFVGHAPTGRRVVALSAGKYNSCPTPKK